MNRLSGPVTLVLILAGAYAVLVLLVYYGQARLLYLPNLPGRELTTTPQAIGLQFENVEFLADDGVRLHGWYLPAQPARATVLFFHGNAGNIGHRLDSIRLWHDLGLAVFIFDYRGYGRSGGAPSEPGLQRDALAAWRYLTDTRGVAPGQIILFGRSLGAAVAAWLATRHTPGALIVESAFTSVPDMAAEYYWWLPARRLVRFEHATRDYVAQVHCPVLVVHSPEDEIIPFHHAEAIFAAARAPREMLRLRGGHNDGFHVSGESYVRGLDAFVSRAVTRR